MIEWPQMKNTDALAQSLVNKQENKGIPMQFLQMLLQTNQELDDDITKQEEVKNDQKDSEFPLKITEKELILLQSLIREGINVEEKDHVDEKSLQSTSTSQSIGKGKLLEDPRHEFTDQMLIDIFQHLQTTIERIQHHTINNKDYKTMLDLLNNWSRSNSSNQSSTNLLSRLPDSMPKQVLQKMLENYHNRLQMEKHYQHAVKVTSKDIEKWITTALENYSSSEKASAMSFKTEYASSHQPSLLSKTEQFVIHLQQTNTEKEAVQKQLIDQFQKIMQKSHFMKTMNGSNQLSVRLQPDHLGEIMLKLTQVNGEMVVKMMVTSQAAKEMLEGNLQQLRHMFSPHQVQVEKQEVSTAISQEGTDTEDQQQDFNQSDDQQHEHNQDEQNSASNEEMDFMDILMETQEKGRKYDID
ncbi:flagellar hook-length control protein FliK [Gracilibacillus sp. YIM 98692]|uniref:flagellar hook-length control protein FliK n=1 Tax=Gracilibacillus sp. YIM 98692 TaxID=2663532 RepID=UPI0013D8018E|nr:flagellar hook-length control protein FliK [Gracilibacillus sp. YIM 98692]